MFIPPAARPSNSWLHSVTQSPTLLFRIILLRLGEVPVRTLGRQSESLLLGASAGKAGRGAGVQGVKDPCFGWFYQDLTPP